eukprot:TRINITY_DN695_c0_g1_i1.p1 TRINITY_DN695_c0_g1~~TRINITY_DN695_c0_g1_i1.p1  ORF type:complete len:744 (+),score=264.72 TRINITY_DN695_c0_g1_i1:169-2232(+)
MAERFLAIGLDKKEAENVAKNKELAQVLSSLLAGLKIETCDKAQGNLYYKIATKPMPQSSRELLFKYVHDQKMVSAKQVEEACKFCGKAGADLDIDKLEKASGVGVVVTEGQIKEAVAAAVQQNADAIKKERYRFNQGRMLGQLTKQDALRWASGEDLKAALEQGIKDMLGPRTADDDAADEAAKGGKKKEAAPAAAAPAAAAPAAVGSATGSGTPEDQAALRAAALGIPAEGRQLILLKDVAEHVGKEVVVRGWLHQYRKQSAKLGFAVLRDGTSRLLQCIIKGQAPDFIRECTVAFRGALKAEPKAASGKGQMPFELHVSSWALIGKSDPEIENVINAEAGPDTLLNQRHIHLRATGCSSLQRVRTSALRAFRTHFWDAGCHETQPPTLVQTQCEGGATLFGLDFYGEQAYLTQSSQLYLETAIPFMSDCFCILPSYRAEKSKTRRHLSEFQHIEAEYPFIEFDDLLHRIEDMVCDVTRRLIDICGDDIKYLNPTPLEGWVDDGTDSWKERYIPKKPFRRLSHADAIRFCRENKIYKDPETEEHFGDEDDIPDRPEREMVAKFGEPIFMIKFPATIKSFYMKRCEGADERHLTESVDLLMPGVGEIVGGSMRIHEYDELMAAYEREGLDPKPYYWFTDQRRYGAAPHGGFGLGLERFLLWLCAGEHCDHVRDTCLYPRLMGRCQP